MKLLKRALATATPGWQPPRPSSFVPQQASTLLKSSKFTSPAESAANGQVRTDWTRDEIQSVYDSPLLDLLYNGAKVHRMYHDPRMVQQCTLLSIKTGGCTEDCAYWYFLFLLETNASEKPTKFPL
jgi:biotin synthase